MRDRDRSEHLNLTGGLVPAWWGSKGSHHSPARRWASQSRSRGSTASMEVPTAGFTSLWPPHPGCLTAPMGAAASSRACPPRQAGWDVSLSHRSPGWKDKGWTPGLRLPHTHQGMFLAPCQSLGACLEAQSPLPRTQGNTVVAMCDRGGSQDGI